MEGDIADVVAHYESSLEEDRLSAGLAALELLRTQELLRRHLPAPPAQVLDVGGGTGVHADWLLADGYGVHLLDITPRHVDQALRVSGDRGLTAEVGDARRLSFPDDSFDVVLVLGPLYHLHEQTDRIRVLEEARRVVRPNGLVAAAAISRFASLFDGLVPEFLFASEFRDIVRRDLADGRHTNPQHRPHWFTTAFFHRPEQLADEIGRAELVLTELVGVEGLAGWLPHLEQRWANEADRDVILERDTTRRVRAVAPRAQRSPPGNSPEGQRMMGLGARLKRRRRPADAPDPARLLAHHHSPASSSSASWCSRRSRSGV